ncbi:MAG TPA: ABC transporter permease [Gemmatimonadaceae bacterium]|nr:ABC transporter permease [Gemmatimonadaceae bacterium]
MSFWRQLTRGVRVLVHRTDADRDLADEVQHYLEQSAAAHEASGLSPDDARRAARREIGNVTVVRERVRDAGWEHLLSTFVADVRYAARRLRRSPGFTLVCTLTLALGIGASTAIFSAVDPVLFEPLPYPHGNRIVSLADFGSSGQPVDVTYGTFNEVAHRSRSFAELAATDRWAPALTTFDTPERLTGALVTARYFQVFGVLPVIGRSFDAADDAHGAPRVAIVSDAFARRHFGDARAAVGRTLTLDGNLFTVIGVMPPSFEDILSPGADVWAPRRYQANTSFESAEWGHHMRMIGRLASGVTVAQARRDIAAVGATPTPDFPRPAWASMQGGLDVQSLRDAVTRGVRPALLAIMLAVALVLGIACVNVTNLLLARGTQRRSEMAMRAALGAGRGRLVRQLLTETLLLAILGGALGLGVSTFGVRALVALAPAELPRASAIGLDTSALLFAIALTTLVGVIVGLVPALQGAERELRAGTQSSARTTHRSSHALRGALVVTEVALALVLLVGAGLMLRSLARLFATTPGFDAEHVLTMQLDVAGHRDDSDAARYQFFVQALDRVRHLPGVTAAAFTSQLPLSGDVPDGYGLQSESVPQNLNELPSALRYAVTPGWFRAMRIPLVRGRVLNDNDRPGDGEAIVISESLAQHEFPDVDPIGQRLRIGPDIGDTTRPWGIVVGVVGDVKQTSLALGAEDAFYAAMGQWRWVDNVQSLVVRTSGDPTALANAVERAIWSVDRTVPIIRVATMHELVARSEAQRRFVLTVFETFALAALALAVIGIYGVLASSVAERTRELGVRAALGASPERIRALVLRQGITLAGIGVVIGVIGAVLATRGIVTLLFGVSSFDPITYLGVTALLLGVSGIACWIPAWRAARVDPAVTLRAE